MYVMDAVVRLRVGLFHWIKFLPLLNPFLAYSQRNVLTTQQELKFFYFDVLSFCKKLMTQLILVTMSTFQLEKSAIPECELELPSH